MAISQPLDRATTRAADAQFYERYPNMIDANGRRLPLSGSDPAHAEMRAAWREIYEKEFAQNQDAPPTPDESKKQQEFVPGGDQPPEDICQDCPGEEEVPEEEEQTVTVRISLFFDGTGNNRANVDTEFSSAGESNVSKIQECCENKIGKSDSKSNVKYDYYTSIYLEGIGTKDGAEDDITGSGLGMGDRGIIAKVNRGIRLLMNEVRGFNIADPVVSFHIDAVGFSRGAAAARYFIWRMMVEKGKTLQERLVKDNIDMQCKVEAIFLGLFDTVSSHGTNHQNDVNDLSLNEIYMTKTIVQLAAAEEHRENFRLTTITSGEQIYLPGVHSDIGGGYLDNEVEVDWQLVDIDRPFGMDDDDRAMFARERAWFLSRGWYNNDEIEDVGLWNELKGTRREIRNHYSRIPLQLMAERAIGSGIPFKPTIRTEDRTIATLNNQFLIEVDKIVRDSVGTNKTLTANYWLNSSFDEWHKQLRHDYLHMSARFGDIGMAPNWTTGDPVTGQRMRGENNG